MKFTYLGLGVQQNRGINENYIQINKRVEVLSVLLLTSRVEIKKQNKTYQ